MRQLYHASDFPRCSLASPQRLSKLLPSSLLLQRPRMCEKTEFWGAFSTPTGLRRLGERHKPCEIRAAKISAGEEERRECFRFVLPLEKTGALNYS